jgi:alkylation response protein AidB-like acyl-CoA dehydrogenase
VGKAGISFGNFMFLGLRIHSGIIAYSDADSYLQRRGWSLGLTDYACSFGVQNSHYVQRIPCALDLIADMATDCEAARLLTVEAARKRDAGTAILPPRRRRLPSRVPVEAYLRDAIGLSLYEGTTQIQKLILGRELLGISAF